MEGGEETVSPYSEGVGWSGVVVVAVVVEGGQSGLLDQSWKKIGKVGGVGGSIVWLGFVLIFFRMLQFWK